MCRFRCGVQGEDPERGVGVLKAFCFVMSIVFLSLEMVAGVAKMGSVRRVCRVGSAGYETRCRSSWLKKSWDNTKVNGSRTTSCSSYTTIAVR